MARWILVGGFVLAATFSAASHPSFVPVDPPVALVQRDPGRTTFTLMLGAPRWVATLSRSVTDTCDVVALLAPPSSFEIRVRTLVLPSLYPLQVAVELGRGRMCLFSALHLGPLRLIGERGWGRDPYTRVAMHAANADAVASVGAETDGRMRPFLSATWFPRAVPLWSLTLVVTSGGWRVAVGGTW